MAEKVNEGDGRKNEEKYNEMKPTFLILLNGHYKVDSGVSQQHSRGRRREEVL